MNDATLFTRPLPGGGFVAIEASVADPARCRARVAVERRAELVRRLGHAPPIIAEAEGDTFAHVFRQLHPIAANDSAVAIGVQQWQARRGANN